VGFFLALSYFGCDQSQVQKRFLTARPVSEGRSFTPYERLCEDPDAVADPLCRSAGILSSTILSSHRCIFKAGRARVEQLLGMPTDRAAVRQRL
jgi:hypothetical protein